jgi:hypothetical protein
MLVLVVASFAIRGGFGIRIVMDAIGRGGLEYSSRHIAIICSQVDKQYGAQ